MKTTESILPEFNAERFLKSTICNGMFKDANEFLSRVDCIINNSEDSSYSFLSKIYVDLLMAIESDLKCLIVSLSKDEERPEIAYLTARGKSHKIVDLYNEIENRAENKLNLLTEKDKLELLEKATLIKVSNRYTLFTILHIKTENGIDRDYGIGEYSSLLSFEYIEKLKRIALNLHQISNEAIKTYTDRIFMKGANYKILEGRISEFKEEIGRKL